MNNEGAEKITTYLALTTGVAGGAWVTTTIFLIISSFSQLSNTLSGFSNFDASSDYQQLATLASPNLLVLVVQLGLGIIAIGTGVLALSIKRSAPRKTKALTIAIVLGIYIIVATVMLFFSSLYFAEMALSSGGGL